MDDAFAHDPDRNPHWSSKMGRRVYRCKGCGTEVVLTTNHTGTVWAEPCHGTCKDISNPHTAREVVRWRKPMPHVYVKEAD